MEWKPPSSLDGFDREWPITRLKALAYVIGVILKGDGSVYTTSWLNPSSSHGRVFRKKIELKNTSLGFLTSFNQRCALVLARIPVRVHGPYADGHSILQYQSKDFVEWWQKQDLASLRPIIEEYPTDYLKGRYDSDCSVHGGEVTLCGVESQRELMEFERSLCLKLGLRTGPLRPYGHPGEINFVGNKRIVSREQKLRFSVNIHDFIRRVGRLTVEWRNQKLEDAEQVRNWTPWTAEIRAQVLSLRKEKNLGSKQIVSEIKSQSGVRVPYSTVYSWLRKGTVSWVEYSRFHKGN